MPLITATKINVRNIVTPPNPALDILCVGGGGGGSGWQQPFISGSGGGPGGLIQGLSSSYTRGQRLVITVGAGGAAGVYAASQSSTQEGQNGGDSSVVGGAINIVSRGGGGAGLWQNGKNGAHGGGKTGNGTTGQGFWDSSRRVWQGGPGQRGDRSTLTVAGWANGGGGGSGGTTVGYTQSGYAGSRSGIGFTGTGLFPLYTKGGNGVAAPAGARVAVGVANSGNGGTGGCQTSANGVTPLTGINGEAGSSGVVIITYSSLFPLATTVGSPQYYLHAGKHCYKFTSSGSITLG